MIRRASSLEYKFMLKWNVKYSFSLASCQLKIKNDRSSCTVLCIYFNILKQQKQLSSFECFYCKHILKWSSSKSPDRYTKYWNFPIRLQKKKRKHLVFWQQNVPLSDDNCCKLKFTQRNINKISVVLSGWTDRTCTSQFRHSRPLNELS